MLNNSIQILSTRPLDASITSLASEKGIQITCLSFIDTVVTINAPMQQHIQQLSQEVATVVFTSMNAADAVIASLQNAVPKWNIYCMGGTTKKNIATFFGQQSIKAIGNNAIDLASKIIANQEKAITFFCGDIRRDELPNTLKENNISVLEKTVYQTIVTPKKLSQTFDGILFFSPSAVESFFAVNTVPLHTVLFAVGTTTAQAIQSFTNNKIIIADFPEKEQLVHKAIQHFQTTTSTIS
ncbi:MAG: uroporphyrinogen-III synthase [Chitinophagaceae bacterium]